MTIKAGVVGWPVEHSLSPVLHGHWLAEHRIDGRYAKIALAPGDFEAGIKRLRDEGYAGVNVTVPHKEAAFAMADVKHPAARIAGAANLLVFKDGKIEADNTDGFGLGHALLEKLGSELMGKTVVMLGAGGAARGGILALQARGVRTIYILNRNPERAKNLAGSMGDEITASMLPGSLSDWTLAAQDAALLLNTTSAGMSGHPPLVLDLSPLPKAAAVCDIVYNPLETPLLKDAKARGHVTVDGLGMLMHQAAPAFKAFFGQGVDVTSELRAALEKVLRERQR